MAQFQLIAPCLFGLEGIAGDELRRLNMENVRVEDRRVLFTGDETALETSAYAKENGIKAALEKYSNITDEADVAVISKFYNMLVNKASFRELCEELAVLKFKEH